MGKPELRAKHTSITPVSVNGQIYLFAYNPAQNYFDVYEFTPAAPWLTAVKANPAIGKAKDIINAFTLGDLPYICVYTAKNGVFEIYSVANDLSFSQPYKFYRNHELAVSQHFTTLKPFTQFGQVAFLGYRGDTGYVAMYTVGMAATSPAPDVPPLLMLPVWSHPWASGWTRFAFFQFGGEPFFLKTNTKVLNVNIDHILDTMAAGTAEVGTLLQAQLPDASEDYACRAIRSRQWGALFRHLYIQLRHGHIEPHSLGLSGLDSGGKIQRARQVSGYTRRLRSATRCS